MKKWTIKLFTLLISFTNSPVFLQSEDEKLSREFRHVQIMLFPSFFVSNRYISVLQISVILSSMNIVTLTTSILSFWLGQLRVAFL